MKFVRSWILIILTWVFLQTFPAVQLRKVFKVGVFYDWDGKESIHRLTQNFTTLHTGFNKTRRSVNFIPYPLQGLSFSQITDIFCKRIINEDISAVVLHTKDVKLTRYLAHLASHFWIPAIGSTTKDPSLSDKNIYRSFLRTVPSDEQQFRVALEFLKYTGSAEAFVIVSDDTTHGLALELFSQVDFVTVTVLKIDIVTISQPSVTKYLLQIKASLANVVFLFCDVNLAKHVLWSARDFRMFSESFFWIISENVVENIEDSYILPSGIHAIAAQGVRSGRRFYADRLYNTYELLREVVNSSSEVELQEFLKKPLKCTGKREWKHGKQLYRKIISTSVQSVDSIPVVLDAHGNRANFVYDTLYLQEIENLEKRWIVTGKWIDGRLSLRTSSLSDHGTGEGGLPRLRAAVVEYPPLTMKSKYDVSIGCTQGIVCVEYLDNSDNYTKHCCYGLAIDVLNHVKVELEFEPFVYFVRDGNYGAKNTTSNKWNGIVHDLVSGESDISIDLMTNEARSEVLDFSQRWTEAGLALLVLVGEKKVDVIDFAFLDPFTMRLWLGIVAIVNVYLVALWVTDRLSPYGYHQLNQRKKSRTVQSEFSLDGSMWFSWGVCFDNQFVDEKPGSYSSRAMAVCLAMFALLCLTSYTANLTAHLVSDDTKPDITGIRDPKLTAEDSKLTFGVVKSSFVDNYFELNQDSVMQSLFERMLRRGHLVKNFTDGVERVKNRQLNIFISELLSLDYEVAKQKNNGYPRLQVVGASKTFADTGYSYSFRKNSTWKPKFDLVINKLKAENKPSELYKKWVRSGKAPAEELHERLNEQSLSGVFFVGVALSIVSFIFLFLENKLYSMGLIYRSFSRSGETYERGKRRFSPEVHRKLLEIRKDKKEGITEFPDISKYLERTRKTRASLHGLYNPGSTKSKYEETASPTTPTSFV